MPDNEKAFVQAVAVFEKRFIDETNPLRSYPIRGERAAALCKLIPSREVTGWVGRLDGISYHHLR